MVDHNEEYVALFIDWDNLAISIAADLSGATPDVKRIVQTAQNYGTILIARAYAEWNATSERLNVYRFGVEPVYAPTFRFEADPITQATRGKSLADPCMVADCVDILHLHPKITTFVIVSGDKDLIPVVRLAQLRGKHVVVIGPDYSASVLREITDEFISYRSVIEGSNGRQPDIAVSDITKGGRRHAPVRMPQPPQPSTAQRRTRPAPAPQPSTKIKSQGTAFSDQQQEQTFPQPIPESIESSKTDTLIESKETSYDLSFVIATMVDIVKQRTGEGKERLRATNLKDALMVKLPGFSERKYGFAKFKDFLLAAEKTGVISLSVAGPVHWVSLPTNNITANQDTSPLVKSIGSGENPVIASALEQQVPNEQFDTANLTEDRYADIVKFVIDLRGRSRWLTYTYVLTNLISFLGKLLPQTEAESAARSTLNRLVQEGILRIDREPQEVEVGGIKHRVRMCHLEESHPFVAETLSSIEQVREPTEVTLPIDHAIEQEGPIEPSQEIEIQQTEREESSSSEGTPLTEEATSREERPTTQEASEHLSEVSEPDRESEPFGLHNLTATLEPDHETQPTIEHMEVEVGQASPQPAAADTYFAPTQEVVAPPHTEQKSDEGTSATQATEQSEEPTNALVGLSVPLSLEEAFAAVDKVVRESASSGKARVRLTGLKAKLTGELGHFDEQVYGFKRFKDFLLAAERAGKIRLEASGPVVWVTPPPNTEPAGESEVNAEATQGQGDQAAETTQADTKSNSKNSRSTRRRSQSRAREALVER